MDAYKLAKEMNLLIGSKVKGNEKKWLEIYTELLSFSKTATLEEKVILHKECPKGEMFCMVASGIEWGRKRAENEVTND